MNKVLLGALVLAMHITMAPGASVDSNATAEAQNSTAEFMQVYGRSLPPIGHVEFCKRNPGDCAQARRGAVVTLTAERKADLRTVNDVVNQMVLPVTDLELYGRVEHWTYPSGKGDCEDYVLLKRRLLMERGWPAGALLITVVRDQDDEGHAVLTVQTSAGDFILDNKRPEIVTWNRAPYTFVKRQSDRDPGVWMSLAKPGQSATRETAGTENR